MSGGYKLAHLSGKGRFVNHEVHAQGRLLDGNHRKWIRLAVVAYCLSYADVAYSGNNYDISCNRLLNGYPLQTSVHKDLIDFFLLNCSPFFAHGNSACFFDSALCNSADSQSSDVIIICQSRYLKLQRLLSLFLRIWAAVLHYCLEEGFDIQSVHALGALLQLHRSAVGIGVASRFNGKAFNLLGISHNYSLTGDSVENREIQLLVICLKIHEQFIYLVNHLIDSGITLINLVYEKNRVDALLQGLLENESCLRHRSLTGIHQENYRVYGSHYSLDLRREVRMSRSVHDVNLRVAVHYRTVLGVYGNASFPFYVVAVHNAVHNLLIVSEHAALIQECIHQG